MITKFDSSHYGTADMENLGYAGTPINDRRYSKAKLAKAMHKVAAYAKCMDERGYDTFSMIEHHFQPESTELIPNLLLMAMHLCGVTRNLGIGCGSTSCRCGIRWGLTGTVKLLTIGDAVNRLD